MMYRLVSCPVLLAGAIVAFCAVPAHAQLKTSPPVSGLMVAPPTPDADALAAEMRVLAKNPKDVEALTRAGELTLKLGDPTAAANLFARAEDIRPNSPRLKAGEAAVLVHLQRPGEALRLFQQAEKMGANPASFAAERGLAYDLIGEQERAQRDYRLALRTDPDNAETIRRYALSLGISGKRKQALAELDPLIRRQDHAGWRDRAFVFAMTGDAAQAKQIATAMLRDQMANALAPFFDRLADLSPTDKAFAVHFGELQETPQRLADARMAPPLPPLEPENLDQKLADSAPPPVPETHGKKRHRKHRDDTAQLAATTVSAQPVPAATPRRSRDDTATAPIPVHATTAPPTRAVPATPAKLAAPTPEVPPQPGAVAPTTLPAVTPGTRVGEEDRIIDRIMAGISVPASETETPSAPVGKPGTQGDDTAARSEQLEAANLAAVKKAAEEKAAAKAAAEAKRKAEDAKKQAAAKKAAAEKAAAEKRAREAKEKAEKASPSRIWVQVAGGANEHDLAKAWARVKAKAPEAFKGKTGWKTPLNATNRVLAGPFKSNDAAQDFVNALAKKGVSAFPFTSAKGQKIDKLATK